MISKILFILLISIENLSSKGIYIVEERDGKTYTQPLGSDAPSTEKIGEQIRKLFNFDFQPDLNPEPNHGSPKTRVAAEYMKHLYKQLDDLENLHPADNENEPEHDESSWLHADRIVTMQLEDRPRRFSDGKYRLVFAGENLPNHEQENQHILKAQLRIHILDGLLSPVYFEVATDQSTEETFLVTKENPIIVMDVGGLVAGWVDSMTPKVVTLASSSEVELEIDGFIVVAIRDESVHVPKRRSRRAVSASPLNIPQRVRRSKSAYYEKPEKNEICQKKGLYVDFDALGWKKWVIAPEGFSAFYCAGACSVPFDKSMNVSAHAIVQSMINLVRPNVTSEAKCVPSKLSSMKILLEDHKKDMQIKRYHDMVVQECGCH